MGYDTSQSQFMTMFGLFGAPFGIFIASLIMDKIEKSYGRDPSGSNGCTWSYYRTADNNDSIDRNNILAEHGNLYVRMLCFRGVCSGNVPTSAKLSGSGFCNAIGRVSNIFFPFLVTSVAAGSMGSTGVFVLISVVAVIIGVCILIFGVESRGESVEDIGNVD